MFSAVVISLTQPVEMGMTKLIMVSDRLFMRKSKSPSSKANGSFSFFFFPFFLYPLLFFFFLKTWPHSVTQADLKLLMYLRLSSNSKQPSYLSLLSTGITGEYYSAWLILSLLCNYGKRIGSMSFFDCYIQL